MSIKRYNIFVERIESGEYVANYERFEKGYFVLYSDYEKLYKRYMKLCEDSQKYENLVRKAVVLLNTSIKGEL